MSKYTSSIQLQLALSAYFKSEGLPALTFSHTSKTIYLQGPCGQTICKVFYTGTSKLASADYKIVYDQVVSFVEANKDTLLKLFILKKEVAEGQSLKVSANYQTVVNSSLIWVSLSSTHPLYSSLISRVYSDGRFSTSNRDHANIDEYKTTFKQLQSALKSQQALVAKLAALRAKEIEANDIIAGLSGCSM